MLCRPIASILPMRPTTLCGLVLVVKANLQAEARPGAMQLPGQMAWLAVQTICGCHRLRMLDSYPTAPPTAAPPTAARREGSDLEKLWVDRP